MGQYVAAILVSLVTAAIVALFVFIIAANKSQGKQEAQEKSIQESFARLEQSFERSAGNLNQQLTQLSARVDRMDEKIDALGQTVARQQGREEGLREARTHATPGTD